MNIFILRGATHPVVAVGVEDVDEVGEDLAGGGRVVDDVVGGGGHVLTNGDVLLGGVQHTEVTHSGQSLQ